MAKKSKRSTRNRSAGATGTTGGVMMPTRGEFNPDYSHITRDLKRIGILAGSFFVILIVLSFFLR